MDIGDTLAVLVEGESDAQVVNVAAGPAAYDNRCVVSFFRVGALLRLSCGKGVAIVSPFRMAVDGDHLVLEEGTCLFLRMQVGVRRAVALHVCDAACKVDGRGVLVHSMGNR